MPPRGIGQVSVASFNMHAGVDRAGVPYDVGRVLVSLDADVVVLQEVWRPSIGSFAVGELATAAGYELQWSPVGTAFMRAPGDRQGAGLLGASAVRMEPVGSAMVPGADGRRGAVSGGAHGVSAGEAGGRRGEIGTAVLCRLPVAGSAVVPLDPLRRDHARRSVLLQTVRVGTTEVTVAGTHMAHLSQGSLHHFAQLRSLLRARVAPGALGVLAGDMNLWGAVIGRVLPGWRRAVVGRSWPAAFAIAQPDHILLAGPIAVMSAEVRGPTGSDHRPVRAVLRLGGT